MKSPSVVLNTSAGALRNWFLDYRSHRFVDEEQERIFSSYYDKTTHGVSILGYGAMWSQKDSADKTIRGSIELRIATLAADRTQAEVVCHLDEAEKDYFALLKRIAQNWPESREAIDAYLKELGVDQQAAANPVKDARFRRMTLALIATGQCNWVWLQISDSCDVVSKWLREYNIGGFSRGGLNIIPGQFQSRQSLLYEELWATFTAWRQDVQASEDWGEPINRIESIGGIACKLERSPHGATYVTIEWDQQVRQWVRYWLACLLADMSERWPSVAEQVIRQENEAMAERKAAIAAEKAAAEPKQERSGGDGERRGPTTRTRERANLYKSLKDADRTLSYAQVAMAANKQEKSDVHTEDTVRNAYRAMGWKFERSDRIR